MGIESGPGGMDNLEDNYDVSEKNQNIQNIEPLQEKPHSLLLAGTL